MRLCEKIALSIAVGIFASGLRVALAPLEAEPAVPSLPHQLQQKPAAKPAAAAAPNATAEPSDMPQPPLDPFWTPRDDPPAETVPHYPPAQPTDFDVFAEALVSKFSGGRHEPPTPRGIAIKRCNRVYATPVCISRDAGSAGSHTKKGYTPFIRPGKHDHGAVRLRVGEAVDPQKVVICNEGEARRVPLEAAGKAALRLSAAEDGRLVLVVAPCWDSYGYHLWSCVVGVHSALIEHGVQLPRDKRHVRIAVLKSAWSTHRFGSHTTWDDPTPYSAGLQASTQWQAWRAVVDTPSSVATLPHWEGRCFQKVIVGHTALFDVPQAHATAAAAELLRALGIPRFHRIPAASPPKPHEQAAWRVLVVERKKNFHIVNLHQVLAVCGGVATGVGGGAAHVRRVMFEDHSFVSQVSIASGADVMVGVHGNGLTWTAFMQPNSVLIELWGDYPYNANYHGVSRRANVRYLPVALRQKGCTKRCDVTVPEALLAPALRTAYEHLYNVTHRGHWYNFDDLSFLWDEHLVNTGQRKRKAYKGMGSPVYITGDNL
ncbi:putative membrane-associated protein [Diplonema papillatum]|nr:putative membrane-associated protein [Diplonema papillatum]